MGRGRIVKSIQYIVLTMSMLFMAQVKAIPISVFVPFGIIEGANAVVYQNTGITNTNSGDVPALSDARLDIKVNAVVVLHAWKKNLLVYGILPHASINFDTNPHLLNFVAGTTFTYPFKLHTQDFVDPLVGFNYRFYETTGPGWYLDSGFAFTLGIPGAEYHKFVPESPMVGNIRYFQAGRGNWNPNLAWQLFYESTDWMLAALVGYSHFFAHDGFRHPAEIEYDLSLGRRIYPFRYESETVYNWRLVGYIEFLGKWTDKFQSSRALENRANNTGRDDWGSNVIKFAPGIKWYHVDGYQAGFQYMTRLSHHLNGTQPVKFSRQYLFVVAKEWAK